MKNQNGRKKREFSKIIASIGMVMWVLVTVYALTIMVIFRDPSPMAYVIGSVDAVVGLIFPFYFRKAGRENEIKLRQEYGDIAKETAQDSQNY